jgi:mRNA-degrading endonuclease toxin of MazEF toxin-antitoxin module
MMMNRGDIWMIDFGGKIGMRPVVILTRQNVLPYLNKVSVAEITSKGKGYPTEVFIGQKANLPKPSFIQTDNIHTIPKEKLVKYIGTSDAATMREVSEKVVMALGLES